MEIWVQSELKNYEVSSLGNVRNIKRRKILKPSNAAKHGYLTIKENTFGKVNTHTVHRLIAKAFLPNPKSLEQVNHKNGIKTDNRVENLEWVSKSDNAKHSFKLGLSYQTKSVQIIACKSDRLIAFKSIYEASKYLFIRRASIQDYLSGKRVGPVNGYTFNRA